MQTHIFFLEYKVGKQRFRCSCKLSGNAAKAKLKMNPEQDSKPNCEIQFSWSGNESGEWVATRYPPGKEALAKQLQKKLNHQFRQFRAGLNPSRSYLISIRH